jgi:tripartite ATP-independent transporter DctM subunit
MGGAAVAFVAKAERLGGLACERLSFIGVFGVLAIALMICTDVLLRWLFSAPIDGLNEIVGMGMAVAVAATFPAGAAQRVNLTIDVVKDYVSTRTIAWLKVGGALLLLLFYAFLAWRIGIYAAKLQARAAETVYVQLPMAPFIWTVTVFLGISALVQVVTFLVAVKYALAGIPDPAAWSIGSDSEPPPPILPSPARGGGVGVGRGVDVDDRRALGVGLVLLVAAGLVVWGIEAGIGTVAQFALTYPVGFAAIIVLLLWVLLLLTVPLAAVMGLLGLIGTIVFIGNEPALTVLGNESVQFLTNSQVAVLPLFLMMGSFAVVAGMSSDIYELAHTLLAHRRGGLALATIGGCAGFGALTGSSLATVATIGRVAMPEMRARGYSTGLSSGCVAAGGTLGALVPPSIPLVFYALLTESSIGQLFVAAVIPAVMAVVFYLLAIAIYVRVVPNAAPVTKDRANWREILAAVKKAWAALLLLTVVVVSIYTGICTETEAAAIGAGGAFILALVRGRINRATLLQVMGETTATTALIYLIIFGVLMFSFSMGVTGLPKRMTELVESMNLAPLVVLTVILVVFLFLGSIMDSNTVMFVTIPIVTPLITGMGYDLVWWGIINLIVLETRPGTPATRPRPSGWWPDRRR